MWSTLRVVAGAWNQWWSTTYGSAGRATLHYLRDLRYFIKFLRFLPD